MYLTILLMIGLMSATTVERLNNNMSMTRTAMMMNQLRRLLAQGTVSEEHFTMVRRALDDSDVPSMKNPANAQYEQKIHEIVNTILKELENSFVSFSTEEIVTKEEYSKERDDTINEAKQKTVQYEDEVKELSTELADKQKQLDSLKKKADAAKQALLQAQLQEKTAIQGAESLFTNSVKTLEKNGVSVRKSSCSEYRQMNEFRTLVETIDTKYKFTDVFTPTTVDNVCSVKTCQYPEGYFMGKSVTCGGLIPRPGKHANSIINDADECCIMRWQKTKLGQCYADAKTYSNDRLDDPIFNGNGHLGALTLAECQAKCLDPSSKDPKGRPCVAVEWSATSMNPAQKANCVLLWACDYTKPWTGGDAYKLIEPCSTTDYLTFNGQRQKPSKIDGGVKSTSNCKTGFKFNGQRNSIVQYNSINLAGSSELTLMAWVKLDNFNTDVGLFSYGSYEKSCGFMVQLRVNSGKDIHVKARSNKANSFGQYSYDSTKNIVKSNHIKNWMHITVVKTSNQILFYLDGKPVGRVDFKDVVSNCKDQFQIGRWIEGSPKAVNGHMKDIRVFTEAKDEKYVREAYEQLN